MWVETDRFFWGIRRAPYFAFVSKVLATAHLGKVGVLTHSKSKVIVKLFNPRPDEEDCQ